MNTKTVALVLVGLVVIAGVALAIPAIMDDDDDDDIDYGAGQGRLMIYGNANMDDYIDDRDVEKLENIINGTEKKTEFADANNDGKIDQKDIDMVKKMIDKKPMKIYYKDAMTKQAEPINWPIVDIVSVTGESNLATKILGKVDNITGHNQVNDLVLYSDLPDVPIMGHFNGTGPIPLEAVSQVPVDAIITVGKPNAVSNEAELEANGIPVVRIDFGATDPSPAYITYGYLIDAEEAAQKYVNFADRILADIQKKVNANVAQDDKKKGMVLGYNVIYGRISDMGNIVDMAGGVNAVDWYEHRFCREGYEWLYNYDFDYVVGNSRMGGYDYVGDADDIKDIKETYDKHYDRYKLTDAVSSGGLVVLESTMPTIAKAAYLAEEFYPDLFEKGYGAAIHQELVDTFLKNLKDINFDVEKDGLFLVNPDIYKTL